MRSTPVRRPTPVRRSAPTRLRFLLAGLSLSFTFLGTPPPVHAISSYPVTFYLLWGHREFLDPLGIGLDSNGHVYVTDPALCRITKFDGFGRVFVAWGSEGTAPG
ncbi:MAG: hypothetical protein L0191_10260, partial [Acidobacteria bacterium]|nr:hypothetical protein [Acidobacteriota bacterium]